MSKRFSDEELLDDLRSVAEDLGETPSSTQYSEIGLASHGTIANRFGSWNEALRAAGLGINQEHKIEDDEELLVDLRTLNERVSSTPPRKRDMDKYGDHGARTYLDRFGSWNRAVEAAGFSPRAPGNDYESRPGACPLCGSDERALDFHHWRYGENETGCYLCRDCHDAIHEGKANIRNIDWLPHSIHKLVNRHVSLNGNADTVEILERYNLPDVEPLVERALRES